MTLNRFIVFLTLAVTGAGISASASASVLWPYSLDSAFNFNGYANISTVQDAEKVAYDGDDAIVAATTSRDDADGGVNITLYRYGPDGQRKKWSASGNEARSFAFFSTLDPYRYTKVRDIIVSPETDRVLLLVEIKYLGAPLIAQARQTLLISMPRSGAASKAVYHTDPAMVSMVGMQMAMSDGRLFLLTRRSSSLRITAFAPTPSQDSQWSVAIGWGINGSRAHSHAGCSGSPSCRIEASHLKITKAGNIYIAGTEEEASSYGPAGGLFLLKLKADGTPASHGINSGLPGWAFRSASDTTDVERVAGLVVREVYNIFTSTWFDRDTLLVSAFERPCGAGFIIYRYEANGTYSNSPADNGRSYTHGGSATASSCNSWRPKDMVLIKESQVAIVGEYELENVAAVLHTMNPNELKKGQAAQMIHGTADGGPLGPDYRFNAAVYHSGQQRLLAVGQHVFYKTSYPPRWLSQGVVTRMRDGLDLPSEIFSDGFEGN